WSAEKKLYSFALDRNNQRVDIPSVLATVPMWFGLLDEDKSEAMLTLLAESDHQTDWGMRIISSHDPKYNPGGYHFGSVWPLFTGWASVGEYKYHRTFPAYSNLRANALLGLDGPLGHFTEVLSGDYYQGLSTSSPHQIWSAAMVISPMLRGMLGLMTHAQECNVTFAPHVPAGWTHFAVTNIRAGAAIVDVRYSRSADLVTLEVQRKGGGECSLDFSPALGLLADVSGVEMNGRKLSSHIDKNAVDQHLNVHVPMASGSTTLK